MKKSAFNVKGMHISWPLFTIRLYYFVFSSFKLSSQLVPVYKFKFYSSSFYNL